jgi:hypothetical protein
VNRFREGLEKFAIRGFQAVFRMPLHGDYKVSAGMFQRLDNAVRRSCGADEIFAETCDTLMMPRVYPVLAAVQDSGERRSLANVNGVSVRFSTAAVALDMLRQRAA